MGHGPLATWTRYCTTGVFIFAENRHYIYQNTEKRNIGPGKFLPKTSMEYFIFDVCQKDSTFTLHRKCLDLLFRLAESVTYQYERFAVLAILAKTCCLPVLGNGYFKTHSYLLLPFKRPKASIST